MISNFKKTLLIIAFAHYFTVYSAEPAVDNPIQNIKHTQNGKQVTQQEECWIQQLIEACRWKRINTNHSLAKWDSTFLQIPQDKQASILSIVLDERSK